MRNNFLFSGWDVRILIDWCMVTIRGYKLLVTWHNTNSNVLGREKERLSQRGGSEDPLRIYGAFVNVYCMAYY